MATIRFTDADRDGQGFIKTAPLPPQEPRSLADLLPTPQSIQADAQRIQRQPPTKAEITAMIGLGLLLIAIGVYAVAFGPARPAAAPRISATAPATAQVTGDGARQPSPIPATAPAVAGRVLIAFAAPDGAVLGAIESTRAITPTAHYGDTWIQADVAGSGLVWLRAADSPELAIVGPDLAPRRPPPALAAPAADGARPIVQPTDPPQPPPCASVGVPGKMVQVCDYADLADLEARAKAQWMEQYGGNVGIVTTPTPQEWNR